MCSHQNDPIPATTLYPYLRVRFVTRRRVLELWEGPRFPWTLTISVCDVPPSEPPKDRFAALLTMVAFIRADGVDALDLTIVGHKHTFKVRQVRDVYTLDPYCLASYDQDHLLYTDRHELFVDLSRLLRREGILP